MRARFENPSGLTLGCVLTGEARAKKQTLSATLCAGLECAFCYLSPHASSASRADRRSTDRLPGEALFTP
ncbi:hypothetical protein JZU56_03555, partial [bacterium]|nr:hypothetical protein [bacterium]